MALRRALVSLCAAAQFKVCNAARGVTLQIIWRKTLHAIWREEISFQSTRPKARAREVSLYCTIAATSNGATCPSMNTTFFPGLGGRG